MRHFFILGREPALSLAEILAVFESQNVDFDQNTIKISGSAAVFDIEDGADLKQVFSMLGGSIKMGRVSEDLTAWPDEKKLAKKLAPELMTNGSGKISFGISLYDLSLQTQNQRILKNLRKKLKPIGIAVKRELKSRGRSARYVTSKEPTLSSVAVTENKLLETGAEFILLATGEKILLGNTEAVHGWREASRLDYGRPERDPESGMLPPRLARMLVNLARASRDGALADPFCGSGTIITEALLLGYRNITASDIDSTAIARTKSNVSWLAKERGLGNTTESVRYIDAGIKKLPSILGNDAFDAVITEPYLGPSLRGKKERRDIEKIMRDLSPLYDDMLRAVSILLKRRGCAVITFPLWRVGKNEFLHAPVLRVHREYGFALQEPVPVDLIVPSIAGEFGMNGKTLIYGRSDQKVWREIAVLEKIN